MSQQTGSVRIGPISLFALLILICIAVLSVLAVTTAHASYASAEKQASFTTDTYTNEILGQKFVGQVDTVLTQTRASGGGRTEAMAALQSALPKEAKIEDNTVQVDYTRASRRTLSITLSITDDAHYRITEWQATTLWEPETETETLWSGGTS